jgi:acyl-CoA thioesterase FadM
MNNVTYYSYFDTAANALLIQKTGFDIHEAKSIGLVVDSASHDHKYRYLPNAFECLKRT